MQVYSPTELVCSVLNDFALYIRGRAPLGKKEKAGIPDVEISLMIS